MVHQGINLKGSFMSDLISDIHCFSFRDNSLILIDKYFNWIKN
ncbi:MAG: hypothetical protein CM15mP63_5650 [Gammaproteobacteria bacterium]|nr:MAG: hypothetical protein CM15mP63_5650 [Gammaproteobacteria bacterium]